MKFSILIVFLFGILIACNKATPVVPITVQLERDITAIDEYLANNGIIAVKDTTGVRYVIHTLGTGPKPSAISSCVRVNYSGKLISDGSQFDSNPSLKYPLAGFIAGWRIVFPMLPQGSKATLYVPSYYGYGSVGNGTAVPGNSNLMFDVELLDVYAYNTTGGYCYDDPLLLPEVQLAKDVAIIDKYLADNNISAQLDPSGLRYTIQTLGTGSAPTLSNCVLTKYTGKLLSGTQFDQNTLGYKSPLKNLIEGWKVGLQKFPKGTKGTLYIPSGMAYGPRSSGSKIPANANLIFEIELVDVTDYNATTDTCN